MNDDKTPAILTGRYGLAPNPCTKKPCLPGMAYALESNGQHFFLTQNGRWSARPLSLEGWTPARGDFICVTGEIQQRMDIRGKPFFTLEVSSLHPAAEPD